jgi:hypothetical protein
MTYLSELAYCGVLGRAKLKSMRMMLGMYLLIFLKSFNYLVIRPNKEPSTVMIYNGTRRSKNILNTGAEPF